MEHKGLHEPELSEYKKDADDFLEDAAENYYNITKLSPTHLYLGREEFKILNDCFKMPRQKMEIKDDMPEVVKAHIIAYNRQIVGAPESFVIKQFVSSSGTFNIIPVDYDNYFMFHGEYLPDD